MRIPEIRLRPDPETEEAKAALGFRWAGEDIGKRHKLGGEPDFVQAAEWPRCCGNLMTFYGQLDSIGDEIVIADCGLIYVFICFDCYEAKAVVQCA